MHAIYDDNKDEVSRNLQSIQILFSPDTVLLTGHYKTGKKGLLTLPFLENEYEPKSYRGRDIPCQLKGIVKKTTDWRRSLHDSIFERSYYLKNDVYWGRQFNEAAVHIYTKS